nr:nodulation protein [Melilotus officinalis]
MAFQIKRDNLFQIFLFLGMLMTIQSSESDIYRLKSIKNSLEDPFNDNPNDFHQSFKGGLIVGYVFSLTCSVMLTCIFYSKCVQFKKKKNSRLNKAKELGKYICSITSRRTRMIGNQMHEFLHPWLAHKEIKEISVLLGRLTSTIWLEELRDTTDCFAIDNAIGVGKMGMMYQGNLPNGQLLAVKRLFNSQLFERQFLLETTIMGRYKHKNIAPMLGYCIEGKERLLAYAYMSNGRLSKWLHPLKSEVMRLKWPERANIALGIARGLSWLHHNCDLSIVHFNICSQCILLDENFEPKISNFGEAKFMNPNIEDDLGRMFKVNDGKKDVHDFGSVLFELITGKTYDELTRSSTTTNLYDNPSNFYNAIDKSLAGEGFENGVCTLLKIACECVKPINQRPTMLEVYNNLSNVRKAKYVSSDDSNSTGGSQIASGVIIDEITEL